jgi:hypothetical protein
MEFSPYIGLWFQDTEMLKKAVGSLVDLILVAESSPWPKKGENGCSSQKLLKDYF